jgi:flagellar motility protein MotE (MotC chaperone)
MKQLLLIGFLMVGHTLFALQTSDKIFECTEIFKERKSELLVELERIDEQKQALSALKTATEALLKKKKENLDKKEQELDAKLQEITQKEKNTQALLEENKKILAQIKDTKMSRIAQTYAKMKANSAAAILSDMPTQEAVKILQSLQPKIVGKILAKMDPAKASKITQSLTK